MAKDKNNPVDEQQAETGAPAKNTHIILTALTREELAEKTSAFAQEHEDENLIYGAVGRSKDDGTYSQRIDIINK